MAGVARRLLVATVDGVAHAASIDGVLRVQEMASAEAIDLALEIDADVATLSLAARDPAGHRWRDGWALEIDRGDSKQLLEPGSAIELRDARRGPIVAHLRVRRRCVIAERSDDNVPLLDAAFHRYTRQSSIAEHAPSGVVPWMTPTRAEPEPWWEIDLGKSACIAWMRIDLRALPAGTRLVCHAFGYPAPSGAPPAGSVVAELEIGRSDALHSDGDQVWFVVDEPVVARYVRIRACGPNGESTALAICAAEIQSAELFAPTLRDTVRRAFVLHAERTLCLVRSVDGATYEHESRYTDLWARATALSRGLAARLEPRTDRIVVGVMTRNRPEWIVADLAILERGYISVALSPDDPDDRLAQILALAKPTCMIVEASNAARVARLGVEHVITVEELDTIVADSAPPPAPRSEDDVYAILFTSGSTGVPKGAMRTYRTFHAMIASYTIGHSPRHLSFQPLSHLSERMYLPAVLVFGGCIAFSRGGAHLVDELAALRPTSVGSVPRLYEVLHAGHARRLRAAIAEEPHVPKDALEARILAETRAQLGDRLLAVSVGSAPCSAEVLAFLRRCFADVWVSEGYGTTELGTIAFDGRIADHVKVKLVPLPDAQPSDLERGEIWVKTPHVIAGYLGEATTTVDDEGYVATGDLGERDKDGRVKIVGRIRNTIKLAQGEFVSIDRIEAVLALAPDVDQIFIHAGYGASHLSAVVVPRGTFSESELRAYARTAGLASYEVPNEFVIESEPFSVENGLLTASGKLARAALVAKYGDRLGTPSRATMLEIRPTTATSKDEVGARLTRIASHVAKRPIAIDEPLGAGVGVDSLAAAEILAAVSEELDREVPLNWWFEARTLGDLAARLASMQVGDAANIELARADLARATPVPSIATPSTRAVRRVLLTGATGFLGSFLVEALRARDLHVTALVRARDRDAASQRLADVLAGRRIDARCDVVAGDLADLSIDVDVDAIVHAGATVSWLASYEALRAPNVLGTLALLDFAAKRDIAFHHVSTISTAPHDGDEMSVLPFEHVVGSTPYALSKWIAEDHVRRAGQGGMRVAIYRPAMIAADTKRGVGNAEDYLNRYMVGCAELGVYVDREDAVIDMTPVDYVASAIAECVVRGRVGETLHLANVEQSLTYAALGRALVDAGVRTAPATYQAFRAALLADRATRLHPLAAFFPERFSLGMGPWPCERSVRVLGEIGVERPRVEPSLIARYVETLRDRGAIT